MFTDDTSAKDHENELEMDGSVVGAGAAGTGCGGAGKDSESGALIVF